MYCQPFQVPSVRQGEAAALGVAEKAMLIRKNRKKDKGSDCLVVIYDPKFFEHHYGKRNGVATMLLHPSYSGL